jgi:hypothetical protein
VFPHSRTGLSPLLYSRGANRSRCAMIGLGAGAVSRSDWQHDAAPWGGSRRLRSLWGLMFIIDAGKLLSISNWISMMSSAMQVGGGMSINLYTIQSLRTSVAHLKKEFSFLGMDASEISADRLDKQLASLEAKAVKSPSVIKNDELHKTPIHLKGDELQSMSRMFTDLTTRATNQLKSRLLLAIPPAFWSRSRR